MPSLNKLPADTALLVGAALVFAQGCGLATSTSLTMDAAGPKLPADRVVASRPAQANSLMLPVNMGKASWYGPGFSGKKTASGEIFDDGKLTAAHKTLPLGSRVKVTNLTNGKAVEVEINDRGPYVGNRIIDLSRAAARAIGMVDDGVVQVRIEPAQNDG